MQLGRVRFGPRKRLAAAALVIGLGVFAVVVQVLGLNWAMLLLAAGIGITLMAVAWVIVDSRRQLRLMIGHTHRVEALHHKLDALREEGVDSDELVHLTEAVEQQQHLTRELKSLIAGLSDGLRRSHYSQRRAQAGQVWTQAQLRRQFTARDVEREDWDAELALLRSSELFDTVWYEQQAPESAENPIEHYMTDGVRVGLDPHPLFSTMWYLERHPEALHHWRTPLAYFLSEGGAKGDDPHPAFWSSWYARRSMGRDDSMIPVLHYLREGFQSDPNPVFRTIWYRRQGGIPPDVNPLVHYLTIGAHASLDPSPFFDTDDVARRLGAVAQDPLSLFLDLERDPHVSLADISPVRITPGDPEESEMKWEYLTRGLHHQPDTFVLYRIIGNDLPPRHREGQGLDNLRFVLEHEPALPGAEKRWVVNRIIEPEYEKEVISLLEEHGISYIHIPFILDEYRKVGWRFQDFELPGLTYRAEFDGMAEDVQLRALDHVYHDKNLYVMNNNGARNAALRQGRTLAKWVLPWDGNCFLTAKAWNELVEGVTSQPHLKYLAVPMARITDNELLLRPDVYVKPDEEPQILFRTDAREEFDEDSRYGRRPKVNLFYRLGIPGPWDRWRHDPWDRVSIDMSSEAGQFGEAGWVARLFSGEAGLEADIKHRGRRRVEAIRICIDDLDSTLARESFDPTRLVFLDEVTLEQQRAAWKAGDPALGQIVKALADRAAEALEGPLHTVVAKTTLPPSGNPHDYWHPAPYWWPNPDTRDGLPYVKRDGQRVPGTLLWEPGSEQYDRSALQSMIDETTLTALMGYFTDEQRFFERGANLIRSWFLAPETRMNPHLRYSQVRRGHNEDQGTHFGIIETKDFYYLLDAIRLLEQREALGSTESEALREWFSAFRSWVWDSHQGRDERGWLNNHGTWYDVQLGAIDAYLDNMSGLLETLRRSHERVGQQFTPDGRQPEELARTLTQHYCAYNLQGWLALGTLVAGAGQDLFAYRDPHGAGLGPATQWLVNHAGGPWPYQQIEPFDEDRLKVLACEAKTWLPVLDDRGLARDPGTVKQVFSDHDGIRPFWLLGDRAWATG